mmetsp:Transcript_10709/g.23721  ORF Transcript_10709/g.23721 Transcript_10709/m.23721 type:complete len:120 (+) Transcript_10709:972-1331(+)
MTTLLPSPMMSLDITSSENDTLARFLGLREEGFDNAELFAVEIVDDGTDVVAIPQSSVASGLWSATKLGGAEIQSKYGLCLLLAVHNCITAWTMDPTPKFRYRPHQARTTPTPCMDLRG